DPADHPRLRGVWRGGGACRHQSARPHGRDLQLAVCPARARRRGGLRAGDPWHLDRLHPVLPVGAAAEGGGTRMSAVTASPPATAVASGTRSAARWLTGAIILLLCAWVLLPIYLIAVNALSAPADVTGWPKRAYPGFDFGSLSFFINYAGVARALLNSVLVAALTMLLAIGLGAPAGYAIARF